MHLAEHGDGFGFDFAADLGIFADGQDAGRNDFALDLAVNHEFVLKFY